MKTIWMLALVVITSLLTSGCGTILNLKSGDPDVYGGAQKDVDYILTPRGFGANTANDPSIQASGGNTTNGASPQGSGWNSSNRGGSGPAFLAILVAADTGLSLVADTLTLPLVLHMRHVDPAKEDETTPAAFQNVQTAVPAQEATSLSQSGSRD